MTRRQLLRLGVLGGAGVGLAACGGGSQRATRTSTPVPLRTTASSGPRGRSSTAPVTSGPVSTTSVPATTSAPATSGPSTAADADWRSLAGQMSGRLVRPGDPSYALDSQLYDPRFDNIQPAAIAFCANPDDVARCTEFGRTHALALTGRSGGHSYAGYSTTQGLVIDVSLMSIVQVNSQGTATVGAGARLADVYYGLSAQGAALPAGSCPTVGIAGLALGGGVGVNARWQGLTSDKITSLQLVTADGRLVTASAEENSDLYWACQGGGGGNFGVVTSFDFSTFDPPTLALFSASWPWAAASQLLPAWLEWVSSAPDELWSNCILEADPGAPEPYIFVGGTFVGTSADAASYLGQLAKQAGPPKTEPEIGVNSYLSAMMVEAGCQGLSQAACHLQGRYPGGTLTRDVEVAKSDILNSPLSDQGAQAFLNGVSERHGQGGPGAVAFDSWGGAVNRVAPDATAFVHRKAIAGAQYAASFGPQASAAEISGAQSWLDNWYASTRPFVSGEAYQNYIDPNLKNWADAYYGSNLARLSQVKAKWDPNGTWSSAQSIPAPA